MSQKSVQIEIGLYSLVHTGLLGTLGQPQQLDASKMALLVLNDPADVYYEIHASTEVETIHPKVRHENCVLTAIAPEVEEADADGCGPSRLFCHAAHGVLWPGLMFRSPGALGETGPYDTAFVMLAKNYEWTNDTDEGVLKTTVALPDGTRVFKYVRGAPTDQKTEILAGKSIEKIVLKSAGGPQQSCCPTGWPP